MTRAETTLRLRPHEVHALRWAILEVLAVTREEIGCLAIDAFRSVRDAREFYVHSRWKDLAAFEYHGTLAHTVHFVRASSGLTTILEPLGHLAPGEANKRRGSKV